MLKKIFLFCLLFLSIIQLVKTQTAIPIRLIVNKAVNNSFKYAFPDSPDGEVVITLKETGGKILLSISDNLIGLKHEITQQLNSLGLELIKGLATDLRGNINFETNNGTAIKLIFLPGPVSAIFEGAHEPQLNSTAS